MTVTDPAPFLAKIDVARFDQLREWVLSAAPGACHGSSPNDSSATFTITEPKPELVDPSQSGSDEDPALSDPAVWAHLPSQVRGKVQRFGDMVDTDAIIPAQMMGCSPADMVKHGGRADMTEDEFLGSKCFAYVRPEFSGRVKEGMTVVVGGEGFGCGSSREEAVRSLKHAGVQAVIAKSFAFIYARNQPNMSLLGVVVKDEDFYTRANEGSDVEVNVDSRTVTVYDSSNNGGSKSYPFTLSTMEERFLQAGGVEKLYKVFKKGLFKALVKGPNNVAKPIKGGGCGSDDTCGSGNVNQVASF
jgi:homoaconitate hydratase